MFDASSRRPTMRDVAEVAGVSVGTVSRVVSDAGKVTPATTERVRAAIRELGFQRDEVARSLRPGQDSKILGLLLGDLANPFYPAIAQAVLRSAREHGYAVLLAAADEDAALERRTVSELVGRRASGLLIVPNQGDHSYLAEIDPAGRIPIVFVDRPAKGAGYDVVMVENERGGSLATRHLINHGHRRIAVLAARSHYTTSRRLRGYRSALREAGIPVDEHLVIELAEHSSQETTAAIRTLLESDDPPTALFSTTNFLTEAAVRTMASLPWRPALVGFDDFRFADLLREPVSVVSYDTDQIAVTATENLLRRIDGDRGPARRIVMPVSLIERGSGEVPPAPDRVRV